MVEKKIATIAILCVVTVLSLGLWANSAQEARTLNSKYVKVVEDYNRLNLDYSKQIATFGDQVTSLQRQVVDIIADKNALMDRVTTLQEQLTTKTNQIATLQDQATAKNNEISTLTAQVSDLQEQLTSIQVQIAARDSQIAALQKLVPISKFLSTSLYPAVQIGAYVYQLGFSLSNGSPWTITVTGVEFFDKDILWHTISTNDIKEIWGTGNVKAEESFSGHLSFQLPYPIEEINDLQVTWHCLDSDGVEFDVTGP